RPGPRTRPPTNRPRPRRSSASACRLLDSSWPLRRRRTRDRGVGHMVGQWRPPDVLTGRAGGRKTRADPPRVPPVVPRAPGIPAARRDTWTQHLAATPGHSTWARHLGTAPGRSTWPQHLAATPIGLRSTYGIR